MAKLTKAEEAYIGGAKGGERLRRKQLLSGTGSWAERQEAQAEVAREVADAEDFTRVEASRKQAEFIDQQETARDEAAEKRLDAQVEAKNEKRKEEDSKAGRDTEARRTHDQERAIRKSRKETEAKQSDATTTKDKDDRTKADAAEIAAAAHAEEQARMPDSPVAVLTQQLNAANKALDNTNAVIAGMKEQLRAHEDQLAYAAGAINSWDSILTHIEGSGYNYVYKTGEQWMIHGRYNGPFSCFLDGDGSYINIRGGLVISGYNVGEEWYGNDAKVGVEHQIAVPEATLSYLYCNIVVDLTTGAIDTGDITYGFTTNVQDLDQASSWRVLLAIVEVDSGTGDVYIHPRWDAGDIGIVVSYTQEGVAANQYYTTRGIKQHSH